MNKIRSVSEFEASAVSADASAPERLGPLLELAKDQSRIDEFLEAAVLAAKSGAAPGLEDLVLDTLADFRASDEDDRFRNHCNFEVQSDKFAVFVLEDRKEIVASNKLARERFDIKAATDASELDLVGLDGRPFTQIVTAAMESRDPTSMNVPIAQAYSPSLKRRLDVAILHLHVCALMGITKEVILICDAITPSTLDLFAEKFGLTPAEAEIVQRFSTGQSIDEIATARVRSVATVKTQFYKILEKCGAGSQSELLQMVARIESLSAATAGINEEFSHPHRRIFKLMRPGNRTLDVVSAGKPDGRPVVSCNSFTFRTCPAWLEEELYQNDLKLYSVAPPGSGETSQPLEGQTLAECFAADLVSLVDNIGCEQTVLIGSGVSLPLCIEAAHLVPERIKAVFSNSALAPADRLANGDYRTGPLQILRDALLDHREDAAEVVSGALFRVIIRFGVERCMDLALKNDRKCAEIMARADHENAVKQAFSASIAQGVEFNVATLLSAISEDWEDRLASCPRPVHLAIGERDKVGPFAALEALAADHPDRIRFTAIPDANSLYLYTHHQAFFDAVSEAYENP